MHTAVDLTEDYLPPKEHLAILKIFLDVTTGSVLQLPGL